MSPKRTRSWELLAIAAALATAGWAWGGQRPPVTQTISELEAARILYQRGDYLHCREVLLFWLYRNASDIEAEHLLARCHERLGDTPRACVMYTMCLRSIREAKAEAVSASVVEHCQGRLAELDGEGRRLKKAYEASAARKKFISPEQVSDLWMTHVVATKLPLDMLQHPGALVLDALKKGWKLDRQTAMLRKPPPGGEKPHKSPTDLRGPQRFPERHASGAAFIEEAGGRKGILKICPNWQTKTPSHFTLQNIGKGSFLRIGTSPPVWSTPTCEVAASEDVADFVLNVYVGEKKLFTQVVGGRRWHDLKIDLGEFRGQDVEVIVENAAGGQHPYQEGAYFDYIDFFED